MATSQSKSEGVAGNGAFTVGIRVAILWTRWSGYMEACYRELASTPSVDVLVCMQKENGAAPFDPDRFSHKPNLLVFDKRPDAALLKQQLTSFQPDVILICSWNIPEYRQISKLTSGKSVRVLAMDNQWHGTAKQILGIFAFRTVWHGLYDAALVSGPRQYTFARLLGFRNGKIHLGNYSCDVDLFSGAARHAVVRQWLYVGRSAPEKGLDILVRAYRKYRNTISDPWPLLLVGLREVISDEPGVECVGFVQPQDLPSVFGKATALVLPSRFEPHGVIIQEAAAAGLTIVCSDAVGAGDVFVRPGLNGIIFETASVSSLAKALVEIHHWDAAHLSEAFETSRNLALQFTPRGWASTLLTLARSSSQRDS